MKYYFLCLIAVCAFFKSEAQIPKYWERCPTCNYKGGIGTVSINARMTVCKFRLTQLGIFVLGLDADSCSLEGDTLTLRGRIFSPFPSKNSSWMTSPQKGAVLLRGIAKGKKLKIKDTLAISNEDGGFLITTKVDPSVYIILVDKNRTGRYYHLSDFIPAKCDE